MHTTIFISDNQIRIIRAKFVNQKLKSKRVIALTLNDGIVEDGLIKNEEEFMKILYGLKNASSDILKDVTLVLDGRYAITKKIDIPKLTKKQMEATVQGEMAELTESYGELNYDYSLYDKKKTLLCCAIPKNIADDYYKIFLSHGIKIKKIDLGINAIIKLTQKIKEFRNKTYVINIIYSNNILSLLFENNNYVLSTRLKINEPRESEKYIEDIYNKLSTFIQFNKAQKSDFQINYSYYFGLDENEIEKLIEINGYENIEIVDSRNLFSLNTKHNPSNFIFNIAALLGQEKDINLLVDNKKENTKSKKISLAIPIYSVIFLIAIVLAAKNYLSIYYDLQRLDAEINKVKLYTDDPENKTAYEKIQKTQTMLDDLQTATKSLEDFESNLPKQAILNSDKFNKIFSACEESVSISALTFTSADKTLTLDANAVNAIDITNFVKRLKATKIFLENENGIIYNGYKMDSATQLYKFKLKCILKAGEANE